MSAFSCTQVLFDLARYHAPSTIFLDEIDALMGARGAEGEHEASRRMKTELLIQMDGLSRSRTCRTVESQPQDAQVFVLAATNMPWELDMVGHDLTCAGWIIRWPPAPYLFVLHGHMNLDTASWMHEHHLKALLLMD